jgi:hypothetical protein
MTEKLAQASEGKGCTPTSFLYKVFTITYKVAMYATAERADRYTPLISYLPVCTLWFVSSSCIGYEIKIKLSYISRGKFLTYTGIQP